MAADLGEAVADVFGEHSRVSAGLECFLAAGVAAMRGNNPTSGTDTCTGLEGTPSSPTSGTPLNCAP